MAGGRSKNKTGVIDACVLARSDGGLHQVRGGGTLGLDETEQFSLRTFA